jgi:hypothetical protein
VSTPHPAIDAVRDLLEHRRNIMNRRSILSIYAITVLGLALVPSGAVAQQGTLKQQLVGAWTLVSFETTLANGTKGQPLSANPKGILILEAGGRYAVVFGRPDRPMMKNLGQPTTEERATAQEGFVANFGTWSISEADKILTRHREGALVPNTEGQDFKASVSLTGDELKLSQTVPLLDTVYRRAR